MKKVLLSSVAALAVFSAAAPVFAADNTVKVDKDPKPALDFKDLKPATETPATPGTHEEPNNFTRTNKEDRAKAPAFVGKKRHYFTR